MASRDVPAASATLVGILRARAGLQPQRPLFTFLRRTLDVEHKLTFADLDKRAQAIAARIQGMAKPGELVAVLCPNDLHFIEAFMGCQYAGAIPVPSPSLQGFHAIERLRRVLGSVNPAAVVTTSAIRERLAAQRDQLPELANLRQVCVDEIPDAEASRWSESRIEVNEIAFLQFTSGSLSAPKGVKVSHANILHNLEMLHQSFGHTEESRVASWLPFFHDWGLIGGLLQPIYSGIESILFDPFDFVRNPANWLEVISRHGATVSGAPNFAYDMCCRAVRARDCARFDLQRWKFAILGAEPIRASTLKRFAAQFEPCGFSAESFFTSYGLAESTLAVTGSLRQKPRLLALKRPALERGEVELAGTGDEYTARVIVGCGQPLLDQEVRIVDPDTCTLRGPLEIGEVWVSGRSVAQGYWGDDSSEQFYATLSDSDSSKRYLRTGDQGFLHEGELYLTGRIKDLMIVNGRNLYPEDVERIAGDAHPALRSGKGAAFSVDMEGVEQYVIAHEIEFGGGCDFDAVAEEIRRALTTALGIAPGAILLVKGGCIPRTSSGKIRRQACKQMHLARELACVHVRGYQGPS